MHAAVYPPIDRAAEGLPAAVAAVSPQGWAVLGALRAVADGQLSIAEVSRGVRRAGTSAAVARASLSRTLRRLWRAGLVELLDEAGRTLTGEVQQRHQCAALARNEPDASYRAYVAHCRAKGTPLAYTTAADFVEAWRDAARWLPYLRVQQVQLTASGRQAVNDLPMPRR